MIAQLAFSNSDIAFQGNHLFQGNFYGMNISLGDALWFELFDHIHHRGQLSVYVRLAGAKLPSIYGPTADEPITAGASDQ